MTTDFKSTIYNLTLSTDRDDKFDTFQMLADFVDNVRNNAKIPDTDIELKFDYNESDHESATYFVEIKG